MAEMVAFDAGPFHIFQKLRDLFKRHKLLHELFTCFYCQSAWWAIVAGVWIWSQGLGGQETVMMAAGMAGLAVIIFRVIPGR